MTQVVILAGGTGSRMDGTNNLPKSLTPIGDRAIIQHIMEIFSNQGFNDFVVALGFGSTQVNRYFDSHSNPWAVKLVDTGAHTENASRLLRLKDELRNEPFFLTWCDGLYDINLNDMLAFHREENNLVTLATVNPVLPYGLLELADNQITKFIEKPRMKSHWINAGVSVVSPATLEIIQPNGTSWEENILPELAAKNQLNAFRHHGFWKSMDTQKEAAELNVIWEGGHAPWLSQVCKLNEPFRGGS